MQGSGHLHVPAAFTLRDRIRSHGIGGRVRPRANLEIEGQFVISDWPNWWRSMRQIALMFPQ